MKQRYYSVDAAKFAFTLMIAVFHFWSYYGEPARGGFIAVEFFFIASGFFLMKQWEEHTGTITPVQYTWQKIKKFYPHYLFSFLILFLYRNVFDYGSSFVEMARNLLNQATEIFMLYGTILSNEKTFIYNSMTWYLSVLLLVGYVLWAILKRHKSALLTVAPIIVFWIYAYMAYTLGTTNNWRAHVFEIFNYAALRAIAGMLLGMLVYCGKEYIISAAQKWKRMEAGGGYILYGTGIIAFAFISSYKWFHKASFFYIVCFAAGMILITAGEEILERPLPKSVTWIIGWMSKISYAVYLNHYLVFRILKDRLIPEYQHWVIAVYLVILILYSMLTTKVVKAIEHGIRTIVGSIRAEYAK